MSVSNSILFLSDICQASTVAITLVAYFPQWIKLVKSKTSENISMKCWVLWAIGCMLALFYAVVQYLAYGNGLTLVLTSSAALMCNIITTAMIFHYSPQRKRGAQLLEEAVAVIPAVQQA